MFQPFRYETRSFINARLFVLIINIRKLLRDTYMHYLPSVEVPNTRNTRLVMISDTQNGLTYEIQNIECYKHDELLLFKCKM